MFALLVLHVVVGIGVVPSGRALGRHAFLAATVTPRHGDLGRDEGERRAR